MISVTSQNSLTFEGRQYKCVLGISGVVRKKLEGDGATPVGLFPMLRVLYRPDRVRPPKTMLPVLGLKPNDGWCDDPAHPDYNKAINLPHNASHEMLWRKDHIYDVIAVLGYNTSPIIPFRGSAVFLHCANRSYGPTKGCVAIKKSDLIEVLRACSKQTMVKITEF